MLGTKNLTSSFIITILGRIWFVSRKIYDINVLIKRVIKYTIKKSLLIDNVVS